MSIIDKAIEKVKKDMIEDILSSYHKVCKEQMIPNIPDYELGLKVGAEAMFDKLEIKGVFKKE